MLNWADRFNIFSFLDHNEYPNAKGSFDCMLAAGASKYHRLDSIESLETLKNFHKETPGWLFGHLNYPSPNNDVVGFPAACFFCPEFLIQVKGEEVFILISTLDPSIIFKEICAAHDEISDSSNTQVEVISGISESDYIHKLQKIKEHIQRGDCYEINFCQSFQADDVTRQPLSLFHKLNKLSPNPFAALYKLESSYCICASPERFIAKKSSNVFSQPIKGTAKRDLADWNEDSIIKEKLYHSFKERSENVMIVDLVRNDLSKVCERGSVTVDELFGIYTFPNLHHMISTISGTIHADKHWTEIIEACFPMGSMTGAPKKRVMELTEQYETVPRGLFSGTIGYIQPDGDFDFNVVIRSIFLNTETQKLFFMAGGGITINSDPEQEYAESKAKAEAIIKVLQ